VSITLEEVISHASNWFEAVRSCASGAGVAKFHLYPDARIYTPDGAGLDLDYHQRLHSKWKDEKHQFGDFYLTKLCNNPERVRAEGTVYWEARYRNGKTEPSTIKAVVGENWIIERIEDGSLKFVLYLSTFFQLLPGSAPIRLDL
jgi:hypothetical protein